MKPLIPSRPAISRQDLEELVKLLGERLKTLDARAEAFGEVVTALTSILVDNRNLEEPVRFRDQIEALITILNAKANEVKR